MIHELIHGAAQIDPSTLLAADGILDWTAEKNSQTQQVLRAVAVTVGIIFVIWQAISSRGAMARIIIAIIAAGVFVWGVFNITDIRDRVDDEINAAGVVHLDDLPRSVGWV